MAERRNFERIPFPVEIEFSVLGKGKVKGKTTAKDISLGGIQFQLNEKIEIGSRVALRIYLPNRFRPTTVAGEVVWIKENHTTKGFSAGVRFTQADPFDMEELLRELRRSA